MKHGEIEDAKERVNKRIWKMRSETIVQLRCCVCVPKCPFDKRHKVCNN